MSTCCKTDRRYEELTAFIEGLPDKKGELITVLHKAQGVFGYLPREVQEFVADKMELPLAKVYGVVNFYSFFHMEPKGRFPISVCMGTACYVRGAEDVVDELEKQLKIKVGGVTEDGKFSLDTLRCVGACGLAPVVIVNGRVYGHVTPSQISSILAEYADA
ncbi:MAG: NAD(P)H-dependent oxidoreductase subunit E [Synergistales bacterium]|nr:NAD(P)H-dependent oxidoreductase subunit E [Synergistales bacterium]